MDELDKTKSHLTRYERYKQIIMLTVPSALQCIINMLTQIVNLYFVGHMNDSEIMAGVGMGNMIQNLCALSIIFGFNSVLDTLISQVAGSTNYSFSGVYLNRGMFIMSVIFIPVLGILMNTKQILVALNQDPASSLYAQQYVLAFLPGLYISGLADCLRRFLNNFKKNHISFLSGLIGIILHIFFCQDFVINRNLGITGIGYANALSQMIVFLSLFCFTTCLPDLKEAISMPDSRIFEAQGIKDYLNLGVPSTIMITLDWWVWEFMILISGLIGVKEQAACILIMNIVSLAAMIGFGLEQSSCALVGQQIGQGDVKYAKLFYHDFLVASTILIGFVSLMVQIYKDQFLTIFTENKEVEQVAQNIIYLISLNTFPDCFKGMLKGVIKGLGIQGVCVYVNISGHWIINLSLQWYLGFKLGMGLEGMWIAKVILELYIFTAYMVIIQYTDWNAVAVKSMRRNNLDNNLTSEPGLEGGYPSGRISKDGAFDSGNPKSNNKEHCHANFDMISNSSQGPSTRTGSSNVVQRLRSKMYKFNLRCWGHNVTDEEIADLIKYPDENQIDNEE